MAALAPTVGDVRPRTNTNTTSVVQAGEAIAQLDAVYLDTATGKYVRCVNNSTAGLALCAGVAVTKADLANDYIILMSAGTIDPGCTVVVATEYVVGTLEGTIEPKSDLATGERYTRIGYATEATTLVIDIAVSGIVAP